MTTCYCCNDNNYCYFLLALILTTTTIIILYNIDYWCEPCDNVMSIHAVIQQGLVLRWRHECTTKTWFKWNIRSRGSCFEWQQLIMLNVKLLSTPLGWNQTVMGEDLDWKVKIILDGSSWLTRNNNLWSIDKEKVHADSSIK